MWRVHLPSTAEKKIRRLPAQERQRIRDALVEMRTDPLGGDVKQLGPQHYRKRIGAYRITFVSEPSIRFVAIRSVFRRSSKSY